MRSSVLRLGAVVSGALWLAASPAAIAQDLTRDPLAPQIETAGDAELSEAEAMSQQCLRMMVETTRETVVRLRQASVMTVRRLHAMAEQGAPEGALRHAAREGVEWIVEIQRAGVSRVNHIAERCAQELHAMEVDEALIRRVLEGRRRSVERIREEGEQARRRVLYALEALTGGA